MTTYTDPMFALGYHKHLKGLLSLLPCREKSVSSLGAEDDSNDSNRVGRGSEVCIGLARSSSLCHMA